MSDINSKKESNSNKDNSKKIGDYGIKLGSSIISFCILILFGCLILYASKSCGSGVLDIIISKYYVKGLTDTMLFKPNECSNATENNEKLNLNTQYINRIKGDDDKSLYQELKFSYNSDNKDILSSLYYQLNEISKNPTKEKIHFYQLYQLFINGIISNVSIFNLTFLNSYLKFLNNNFSDSATIIFGPVISVIILLIISTMSMFVTAYYVVYNAQWLLLNTADDKNVSNVDNNSKIKVNGVPIVYKPYKKLLFFPWLGWLGWCIIIGWIIAISIFPLSMGITAYTLLKWLFFIIFLPSTCNEKSCNVFTMFVDTFKYKKPLISWIMSLMVISTSFDAFDTTGGTIAIIVLLLVYFNFIKIGLFDNYVPTDADAFVPMVKVDDLGPPCVTKYEDFNTTVDDNNDTTVDNKDLTDANSEPEAEATVTDTGANTGITTVKEAVKDAIDEAKDTATTAATDVFNKAKDAVKDTTTTAINKVKDAVKDTATIAINKAKDKAITAAKNSMVEMVSQSSTKK